MCIEYVGQIPGQPGAKLCLLRIALKSNLTTRWCVSIHQCTEPVDVRVMNGWLIIVSVVDLGAIHMKVKRLLQIFSDTMLALFGKYHQFSRCIHDLSDATITLVHKLNLLFWLTCTLGVLVYATWTIRRSTLGAGLISCAGISSTIAKAHRDRKPAVLASSMSSVALHAMPATSGKSMGCELHRFDTPLPAIEEVVEVESPVSDELSCEETGLCIQRHSLDHANDVRLTSSGSL